MIWYGCGKYISLEDNTTTIEQNYNEKWKIITRNNWCSKSMSYIVKIEVLFDLYNYYGVSISIDIR